MLCLVNGETLIMGQIYESMDEAKEKTKDRRKVLAHLQHPNGNRRITIIYFFLLLLAIKVKKI